MAHRYPPEHPDSPASPFAPLQPGANVVADDWPDPLPEGAVRAKDWKPDKAQKEALAQMEEAPVEPEQPPPPVEVDKDKGQVRPAKHSSE